VITRADAVRDANRRFTQDYEPHARASIGPNYDKFDNATKIALGSVAHNYGSLPKVRDRGGEDWGQRGSGSSGSKPPRQQTAG
jgi:hypothetical protein